MAFEKGKSGNPIGRPKGSLNKITTSLRWRIENLVETEFDNILGDISSLKPSERVKAYFLLLDYVLPKLNRVEPNHIIDRLSDEQVEELFKRLNQEK